MNHAAVRAVSMRTLNRQRANIVLSTLFDEDVVFSPEQVSKRESIFEWDGVLRWQGGHVLGCCEIGVPLQRVLQTLASRDERTGSIRDPTIELSRIWELYRDEEYLLWYDSSKKKAMVVLKREASSLSQLKAWGQALLVAQRRQQHIGTNPKASIDDDTFTVLRATLADVSKVFEERVRRLRVAGWDVDTAALETWSGRRITMKQLA